MISSASAWRSSSCALIISTASKSAKNLGRSCTWSPTSLVCVTHVCLLALAFAALVFAALVFVAGAFLGAFFSICACLAAALVNGAFVEADLFAWPFLAQTAFLPYTCLSFSSVMLETWSHLAWNAPPLLAPVLARLGLTRRWVGVSSSLSSTVADLLLFLLAIAWCGLVACMHTCMMR